MRAPANCFLAVRVAVVVPPAAGFRLQAAVDSVLDIDLAR
jgi:hypothetical protein